LQGNFAGEFGVRAKAHEIAGFGANRMIHTGVRGTGCLKSARINKSFLSSAATAQNSAAMVA
jgi:hypothetical protein